MPYLGNSLGVAFSSYKLIDNLTASFNGTATSFALTVNGVTPVPFPLNEQNVLITVGGVPQKPDPTGAEGFRFSGSNIVFSSAPKTGEAFWGVVLAGADRVSAGVSYPDGSASAPSVTFSAQTTTGLYRSGPGQIGVGINGSTPIVFGTSGLQINGSTSGSVIIASPADAGNNTLTLPTSNGSANQKLITDGTGALSFGDSVVSGSAQTCSGAAQVDFLNIPSWVKRVTVNFADLSLNGSSDVLIRLSSLGIIDSTGYVSTSNYLTGGSASGAVSSTTGFILLVSAPGNTITGSVVLTKLSGNRWVATGLFNFANITTTTGFTAGDKILTGALDRVRLTTANGADLFDTGVINILYE